MKCAAVIDDDDSSRLLYAKYLQDKYEVLTYESGIAFLDALPTLDTLPDIVILDVMMPVISGYGVCRLLKSSESYSAIKIFICTSLNSAVDEEKAVDAMADDFIVKPVKYKDLHYFIEQHTTD